jgi:predicted DNA-binding transcriptional regulator AlpA
MTRKAATLPLPEKRGLNRAEAAEYVGVSPGLFDMMVNDGRMPKPLRVNARVIWDRKRLDLASAWLGGDDDAPEDDGWSDFDGAHRG